MGSRATASGSITFGLVSLPIKLYTSAKSEKVSFNLLTPEGLRVKQQYVDENGTVFAQKDLVKGYEHQKDKYVTFTNEELKTLEAEKGDIDILEFVPFDTVDFVFVEKSYYVGLDTKFGGEKAFQLLLQIMKKKEVVAIGKYVTGGKEHLIMIRPYGTGLVLHHLFHSNEVRAYENNCKEHEFTDSEMDIADKLVSQLTHDKFDPSKYSDTYSERVKEVVEQKVAGNDVKITVNTDKKEVTDLFAALEASIDTKPAKKAKKRVSKKTSKKIKKAS